MLDFHRYMGFSAVVVSRGCSLAVVCGLLTVGASLVMEQRRHGLQSLSTWPQLLPFSSSRAQTQQLWYTRLCCSVAHGILLNQGWNSHLLHWQADSVTELPGKPHCFLLRLQFYFIFSPGIPCRSNLDKHSK